MPRDYVCIPAAWQSRPWSWKLHLHHTASLCIQAFVISSRKCSCCFISLSVSFLSTTEEVLWKWEAWLSIIPCKCRLEGGYSASGWRLLWSLWNVPWLCWSYVFPFFSCTVFSPYPNCWFKIWCTKINQGSEDTKADWLSWSFIDISWCS